MCGTRGQPITGRGNRSRRRHQGSGVDGDRVRQGVFARFGQPVGRTTVITREKEQLKTGRGRLMSGIAGIQRQGLMCNGCFPGALPKYMGYASYTLVQMIPSMSRKDDYYNNAMSENVFSYLRLY